MNSPAHATSTEGDERSRRLAELSFQPTGQQHGFLRGSAQSLRDVWAYRELLSLLVRRELKARYKDSALGFVWSLIRPLALLLIYYVAIGKFLGAERSIPDFAIYIFTGLTAWALFAEIVDGRHRVDRHQRRPGQEGLPAARGLPAQRHRLGAVQLRHPAADPRRGAPCSPAVRRPSTRPTATSCSARCVLLVYAHCALAFLLSAVNVYLRDVQYLVEIVLMVAASGPRRSSTRGSWSQRRLSSGFARTSSTWPTR